MVMKIKFKSRHLKFNLIFGIFWIIFFILGTILQDELHWMDFGYLVIAVLYLGLYFYQRGNQYLIIENGFIKFNRPFGSKLDLTEVKAIRKFAGDYILKSDKKDFTITTQLIEPESLAILNSELNKLGVEWI